MTVDKIETGSEGTSIASEVFQARSHHLLHLLFTFILSNMIFFFRERLLQRSMDAEQLLVWVYCL
jgi:hypothetical protein